MSAYICSDEHIATIVECVAALGPRDLLNALPGELRCRLNETPLNSEVRQAVADVLLAENVRSFNRRYREKNKPGSVDLTQAKVTTVVGALKLLDSLVYQSCECPDYDKSAGWRLLQLLRKTLIRNLPGYEACPCSI